MKNLMMIVVGLFMSVGAAMAVTDTFPTTISWQKDEKVKIKVADLPEAVKTTLQTEPYNTWSIETVHHNKTKDNYEVDVKKGTEKKTLTFSKDGKLVE